MVGAQEETSLLSQKARVNISAQQDRGRACILREFSH
jgi:hypothetical protein